MKSSLILGAILIAALPLTSTHAADAPPAKTTPAAAKPATTPVSAPAAPAPATDPKDVKDLKVTTPEKPASAFQLRVGIPAWASGISGDVGLKGVSGHVDVPFTSLLDHLDSIAPLSVDATYGKWGFHLDGQYVKLSEKFSPETFLLQSGTIEMEQAFANFNLSYKVVSTGPFSVDAFAGGRFNYMSLQGTLVSAKPKLLPSLDMGGDTSWVDPVLGINARVQVLKPVALIFTGDVGGFGVGSDLTYQALGGTEIQIARHFYTQIGYRYIHTDYSSGGAKYDVDMSGPEMQFGFNF